MIVLKSEREIQAMHESGKVLAACHREIAKLIQPGVTTWEIEEFVEDYLKKHGAKPEQKGYKGYKYATCASINEEICHGFPRKYPFKEWGYCDDRYGGQLQWGSVRFCMDLFSWQVSKETEHLLQVTKESLYRAIEVSVPGNRIGDIGHAIQSYVEPEGFSVVRDFIGHGIGNVIHEEPQVPHYGLPNKGLRLKEGMVFTIEPMVNVGTYKAVRDPNGWTASTADGKYSAQYEHTIALTKNGPIILTEQ